MLQTIICTRRRLLASSGKKSFGGKVHVQNKIFISRIPSLSALMSTLEHCLPALVRIVYASLSEGLVAKMRRKNSAGS